MTMHALPTKRLNPLVWMYIKPRETMRQLILENNKKYDLGLLLLMGTLDGVDIYTNAYFTREAKAAIQNKPEIMDHPWLWIFIISIIFGNLFLWFICNLDSKIAPAIATFFGKIITDLKTVQANVFRASLWSSILAIPVTSLTIAYTIFFQGTGEHSFFSFPNLLLIISTSLQLWAYTYAITEIFNFKFWKCAGIAAISCAFSWFLLFIVSIFAATISPLFK